MAEENEPTGQGGGGPWEQGEIGEAVGNLVEGIGGLFTSERDPKKLLQKLRSGEQLTENEILTLGNAIFEGKVTVDPNEAANLDPRIIRHLENRVASVEAREELEESAIIKGPWADFFGGLIATQGLNIGLPKFLRAGLQGEKGLAVAKAILRSGKAGGILRGTRPYKAARAISVTGGAGIAIAGLMNANNQGAGQPTGAQPGGGPGPTGTTLPAQDIPTSTTTTVAGFAVGPGGTLQPVTQGQLDPADVLADAQPNVTGQSEYSPSLIAMAEGLGINPADLAGAFQVENDPFNPNALGTVTLDTETAAEISIPEKRVRYGEVGPRLEDRDVMLARPGEGYVPGTQTFDPGVQLQAGAQINPKLLTTFNGKTLLEWAADAAARYDVPLNILYGLIEMESNWDINAVGDNGTSFGLAQIHTPAFPDVTKDVALNPVYALNFAARNLHERFELYGRWDAAVAGHNSPVAGEYLATTGEFQTAKSQDYVTNIFNYANASGLDTYKADASGIEVSPEAQQIIATPFVAPDPAALRNYAREQYQALLGRDPTQEDLNAAVAKLTDLYRAGYAINTRNLLREQGLSEDVVQSVNLTGQTPEQLASGGLAYGYLPDVKDPGSESARNNKAHFAEAQAGEGIWGARAKFAAWAAPQILQMFPGTTNWGQFRDPSVVATGAMSPTSDHYSGGALDIHGPAESMEALAQWAKAQPWAANVIYGVPGHTDHVHISFKLGYTIPDGTAVAYNQGELGQETTGGGVTTFPEEQGIDPEAQYEENLRTSGEFAFQSTQTKLRSMTDFAAEIARMLQTGSI